MHRLVISRAIQNQTLRRALIPRNNNNGSRHAAILHSRPFSDGAASPRLKNPVDDDDDDVGTTQKPPSLRLLPTRHSRVQRPPEAPASSLTSLTDSLLSSPVGSWFALDVADEKPISPSQLNATHADEVSDVWSQKVEYVIRGHSRLIPGSLLYRDDDDNNDGSEEEMSLAERTEVMMNLCDRMKDEGDAYRESQILGIDSFLSRKEELRKKREELNPLYDTSQYDQIIRRAAEADDDKGSSSSDSSSDSDDSSSDSDSDSDSSPKDEELIKKRDTFLKSQCGAPPGLTTAMIDLTLDALSLSLTPHALSSARSLHDLAILRHVKDGGYDNTNPKTIPTVVTYNAILRAAANVPWDGRDESVRDEVIDAAFFTFDKMGRSDVVSRNTATYVYLLRIVRRFFPQSRSRGNICAALVDTARTDKVLTHHVIRELENNGYEGPDFVSYREKMEGYLETGVPLVWRKGANKKMYRWGKGRY
eukprot:CAMPEP_0172490694 /NCGR_PEP_ID=MMETSP1066-20121228/21222_1 /TAXON_ID=671091 /ORGANISM="Coscinodiscus wailesii, Strain CCMP2513" /LENGTH=476 /DNA_ID=CAMNT_0013259297 /DNA_START=100 /DNA_END=1530 /DNA_ORIENTATION=+